MVDMFERVRKPDDETVSYVFFDTGIEYEATRKHLDYLETKYGIEIQRNRAEKPVPVACKQYGVPFLSKQVSNMIERLQNHGLSLKIAHFRS